MANKKNEKKKYQYLNKTFMVTLNDGTQKQERVRAKTEAELKKKYQQKQLEYAQGLLTINGNTLFAKWSTEWLETYEKPKVTDKTYKDTKGIVDRIYLKKLGGMKMIDIKTAHLQKCINQLAGKSASYIRKAKLVITAIFEKALLNDIVIKNPARGLEIPKGTSGSRRALTEAEIEIFMQTIDMHHRGLMFAITYACGLRPGEVRSLTRFNMDLAKNVFNVTNAVESGSHDIKSPKTKAGTRSVPIPQWLADKLKSMPHNDTPYLFPNTKGKPLTEKGYYRSWASFLRQMDINAGAELYRNEIILSVIDQSITPYYLRHTYATKLAEAGVDIKTAQYLLGHADIKTTAQIYTHVTPKMLSTARGKIDMIQNP